MTPDEILEALRRNHEAMGRDESIYSVAADEIERLETEVDRLLAKDAVAADEERNIRQYELERQRKMPWWKLLLGFHRTNTLGPK